jgi:AcrR family transcriptional regulator
MTMLENILSLMNNPDEIQGLREQKKVEKLERILAAGRELFTENGYDGTTTRAISERAGIATGTLFSYFPDKRALLVQIFAMDIDQAVGHAFATLPDAPLVDRAIYLFGACFDYYSRDLRLARAVIKEMLFLDPEPRRVLYRSTSGFVLRLAAQIEAARSRGEVRADVAAPTAATAFFAQYYFALIAWVNEVVPDRDTALEMLRQSLHLICDGIAHAAPPYTQELP